MAILCVAAEHGAQWIDKEKKREFMGKT